MRIAIVSGNYESGKECALRLFKELKQMGNIEIQYKQVQKFMTHK